jgi:hypothetical protein
MSTKGTVSHWIEELKKGDEAAAQWLWQRYYQRLDYLARRRRAVRGDEWPMRRMPHHHGRTENPVIERAMAMTAGSNAVRQSR